MNKLKSNLGLSLALAKADFKLRNEGSYLGVLWYLLNPLFLFLILMFIRGVISRTSIEYYPLYLLLGLIIFNFFRGTTNYAITSISANAGFVKSMQISKESLVISRVFQNVFSHFFEIVLFMIFMLFFKISLINIAIYILIFPFLLLFVLGASFFLATVRIYISDLENVWRIISLLIWFTIPIFYVIEKTTINYKLNLFNPMFYFVKIARDIIIYGEIPEIWMIGIMIFFSLASFLIGFFIFEKYKKKFPELV